jgi:hypothetical protein
VVVECSNCGAGPEAYAALILAALSFLVAAVALVYAKRAAAAAHESVGLARGEARMARDEHEEFLRELRARANFTLQLRLTPEPDDDGVIRNDGTVIRVRIEILLKNDGEKVAGETVLNVIAPRGFGLRWCGPRGEDIPGMEAPAETPELLTDADGPDAGGGISQADVAQGHAPLVVLAPGAPLLRHADQGGQERADPRDGASRRASRRR